MGIFCFSIFAFVKTWEKRDFFLLFFAVECYRNPDHWLWHTLLQFVINILTNYQIIKKLSLRYIWDIHSLSFICFLFIWCHYHKFQGLIFSKIAVELAQRTCHLEQVMLLLVAFVVLKILLLKCILQKTGLFKLE